MPAKILQIKNALTIQRDGEKVGRLDISGEVGWDWYGDAWDAGYFQAQLQDLGDVALLEVHINSPGGSVIDGIAIFNYLVQHPAPVHVYVDGVAASIASVIAMAGDKIYMPTNTLGFIHNPLMYTVGNAEELRKDADTLDTMQSALIASYLRHFKGTEADIQKIMDAETWLTANEMAEQFNHVEVLAQEVKIAATLDMSHLGAELPDKAKAFLEQKNEEEDKNFLAKCRDFLKRTDFKNAVVGLNEDLKAKQNQQEDVMTPEEIAAMKAEIVTSVTEAVLAVVKPEEEEVPAAVAETPIEFVGDLKNPDDVKAHAAKLASAKLEAAVDWQDPASVQAYLDAITPAADVSGVKGSNATTPTDQLSTEDKALNKADTSKKMDAMMPQGR